MGCTFSEFINELRTETEDTKTHLVTKSRVDPKDRKQQILSVAVKMACVHGYDKITRDGIAGKANVSMGLVTKYFGSMIKLRRSIMRAAINQEIPVIIAQGLANGDPHARKAPAELKAKAATSLV
jgi:AcrR family transcriptional regulator